MFKLLLLFVLNAVNPSEMVCVGSVQDAMLPLNVYVAAVEMEGIAAFAAQGQILQLNGPGVSGLKPGTIQRVVRPEGRVKDPLSGDKLGFYYKDIGTIRIERVDGDKAMASVQVSCRDMLKGDVVLPFTPKPNVEFGGDLSTALTPLPDNGLVSSILLGKDDARQIATGNFCFLGLGSRDGVKSGDRFTVFRSQPGFNPQDMDVAGTASDRSYSSIANYSYRFKLNGLLHNRKLVPKILGDIIVVDVGERISTGKVINSISEMHVGDFIVKR